MALVNIAELEAHGLAKVKANLVAGIYAANKVERIKEWVNQKESEQPLEKEQPKETHK